jgi:uncharacterized membrane protein
MRPRWLMIGLAVSVALNLFFLGAGAGIVALGVRMAHENAGARPAAFFWATRGMSQPAKQDMRRMLLQLRDQVRPQLEQSRAMRIQAWSGLAAARPDPAAIKQMLAQSRQTDIAIRAKVEDAIVDGAAGLSADDRARLARGFRRTLAARAAKP